MNRRGTDRLSADSHDLASKQRIVRRRVHRSPSPPIPRSASHREVRTSAGDDVYSKMGHSHRSHKYLEFRHSTGDLRDERLGGPKDRSSDGGGGGFNPRHHDNLENQVDVRGVGRGGGGMRKGSVDSGGGGYQSPFHDKFEYSLHVCNIHTRLTDGEAKINLFREFKKFGFVNIKVIGFRKDRHAFINFTRLEDARAALASMNNAPFYGLNLTVTWSRATLNRYPHIMSGSHSDRRSIGGGGGVSASKGRSFQHDGGSPDYFNPSGGGGCHSDHFQDSPRSTRDINYQHPSPPPPPAPRNHSIHPSKDISVKGSSGPMPIIDPNATRTLFVGNLESDVTERELRDLFSPYGRIESVDIKVQRAISTAYAFVKFFTITDAMNAKTDMHGRKYGNIKLKIGFGKGSPSAKVWVGNLTTYADLTEIRTELDRFGLIRRVDYTNGDNHAFVHFDSLDAAQAAVSSLATYRFRSNNRPLKIDLSQPVRPGSDFEDFEPDYHDPVPPVGTGNSRQVHSRAISPEISSHSMIPPPRRSGGMSEDFQHSMPHDDDIMDQHMGMSSVKGNPFRNSRGRRVVTEVHDSAHSRHTPNNGMDYPGDRGSYRKRGRSPGMSGNSDLIDHRPHSFHRHHSERGGAQSNGGSGHRMGGGSGAHNGDFEYKPKRPRNGFDAYQYHKLHGDRGSVTDRIGSSSSIHSGGSDRERDYRDRDRGDDRAKDRRSGSERREREFRDREHRRRSSSAKSDRKSNDNEERGHSRSASRRNSMSETAALQEKKIEEVSPPPPPPPPAPPIMDIMSYETSDPALKLNDSTGPTSPTGGIQPGDIKEVETLVDMARVYPVVWRGNLVLKNTGFPTRMHLVGGDPAVAELLVRCKDPKDDSDSLRITQRLRLEPPRLEEVNKRMTSAGPSGHCILLALPGAIPSMPAEDNGDSANNGMQLRPLKSLVSYLDQKEAAGIVALNAVDATAPSGGQKENIIGVLHAFPPCEFSQSQLLKIAPNLSSEPAKEDHVVVLLVKGTV